MFSLLFIQGSFQLLVASDLNVIISDGFQQKTVTGRVVDSNKRPLAGVNVVEKGTNNGLISGNDGTFSINVASGNSVLSFTFIGYELQEITVGTQTTLEITLTESLTGLNEVVVIGYGTAKKSDVTGSVASVSAAKLQAIQTPNVTSQLKGRTAGVDIVSNSSNPGASGQIRIRGERSLTGTNDPLLVVDGIPFSGSVNDLNPNDIVSLDILKDASATAIYGSRGSNGVIIISTKRGKAGKSVVTFDSYYGITSLMSQLRVFNGEELAAFKAEASAGNTVNPGTNPYGLTTVENNGLSNGTNTDWQNLIYQKGFTTDNQLGISGGNESTQFSLGMGYYNETGIIPHQKFERYNLRATIDHQISKKLRVGLNTMNTLNFTNVAGNPVGTMLALSPLTNPYKDDGTINLYPMTGHIDEMVYLNPLTIHNTDAIYNNNRRIRTFNSLFGEWNILDFLKYRINVGLDFTQTQAGSYYGPNTVFNSGTTLAQARENVNNSEAYTYTIENLIIFDKTYGKHHVGFTGLYSIQKDHARGSNFDGLGNVNDLVQNTNMSFASTLTAPNSGNYLTERGLISYMGRINYGYDNRYLITASIRRDGSSVLSPGHQYFTYPAIALAWNARNEQFLKGVSALTNLKLRLGWGLTANAGISPYSTLGALSTANYNYSTNGYTGFLVTNLANENLKWESTEQFNAGIDFGLFKDRITGSIDVYSQKTSDILLSMSLPRSNGAGSIVVNAGETKGKGIEVNLSTVNVELSNSFRWTTDFTFSVNRNEIVALQDPTLQADIGNGWFVGEPLTVIYDVKKIGIWQTADATAMAAQTTPKQFVGQVRIEDLNGDNKIDAADRQIIGNFEPKWIGGFSTTFSFKGFDLSAILYGRMGMYVAVPYVTADGGANGYPMFMQSRRNQLKVDYWTPENPTNKFPRPDASRDNPLFGSTLGYVDGSFIKVRAINLSYSFPAEMLAKAGINSMRVYVNLLNPFVLYSPFVKEGYGPDPEGNGYGGTVSSTSAGGSSSVPSRAITVNANTPSTRQINFGLNLKF
jgi:TonB-linked SusC/RagA family outer membrane protein